MFAISKVTACEIDFSCNHGDHIVNRMLNISSHDGILQTPEHTHTHTHTHTYTYTRTHTHIHTHTHTHTQIYIKSVSVAHDTFTLLCVREADVPHTWISVWWKVEVFVATHLLQVLPLVSMDTISI